MQGLREEDRDYRVRSEYIGDRLRWKVNTPAGHDTGDVYDTQADAQAAADNLNRSR